MRDCNVLRRTLGRLGQRHRRPLNRPRPDHGVWEERVASMAMASHQQPDLVQRPNDRTNVIRPSTIPPSTLRKLAGPVNNRDRGGRPRTGGPPLARDPQKSPEKCKGNAIETKRTGRPIWAAPGGFGATPSCPPIRKGPELDVTRR